MDKCILVIIATGLLLLQLVSAQPGVPKRRRPRPRPGSARAGRPAGAGAGLGAAGAAFGGPGAAGGALGGALGAFPMINPMGEGRPWIPGMTAAYVTDLMNGRPGPVPMDIAQEAVGLSMMGWTPDQISDTLGDKMQRRFAMRRAASRMAFAGALAGGAGMPGGAGGAGAGLAGPPPV